MKKLIILFATTCLLIACEKNENEDVIAQYFFADAEATEKPNIPHNGEDPEETKPDVFKDGLVAYYPFDSQAEDLSGNNLNGRFCGGIYMTSSRKGDGYACGFTGTSNTYVIIPFSPLLKLDCFTINVWAYNLNSSRSDGTIMQRGKRNSSGAFWLGFNYLIITDSDNTNYKVPLYSDDEEKSPTSKIWHMFTVTVEGNTISMYLDGVVMRRGGMHAAFKSTITDDLKFGVSDFNESTAAPFYGYLDDIRIYGRALNDEEVKLLYNE